MEDSRIISLYWARSEQAITETDKKYGAYCRRIADNILNDRQDSEECVNDTWLRAWNAMPPQRPSKLAAFLGTIARNLALDRWRESRTKHRGGGQVELALEELAECISSRDGEERWMEELVLTEVLNRFLTILPQESRIIFLRRYWYLCPVKEIARSMGVSENKVKMSLMRSRNKLRELLEKEGITV